MYGRGRGKIGRGRRGYREETEPNQPQSSQDFCGDELDYSNSNRASGSEEPPPSDWGWDPRCRIRRKAFPKHGKRRRGSGDRAGERDGQGGSEDTRVKRERRPPHLRGKAIGLYYRDRNRKENKNFIPELVFPQERVQRIEELLDNLDTQKGSTDDSDEVRPLRTHFQREYLDITTVTFMEKLDQTMLYRNRKVDGELLKERNEELHCEMLEKMKKKYFQNMLEFRKGLPTYQHRSEILRAINNNQVVVISGDTGCGKSTQVGQLILEQACTSGNGAEVRVLMTQPRRIAATSLAARIADERGEILGKSVGYAIRLESKPPRDYGSIEVVTAGVVLQRLQRDPGLLNISHLLIDEAHERDTTCDILLGIVKLILTKRKDLKVVLMSATMDSERFCQYFNGCPKVVIPGRMYDVKVYHLEDVLEITGFTNFNLPNYFAGVRAKRREVMIMQHNHMHRQRVGPYVDHLHRTGKYRNQILDTLLRFESETLSVDLACELVIKLCHLEEPGAILVFLPGLANISAMCRQLQSRTNEMPPNVVYPLHSQLSSIDQNVIFKVPQNGVRKIIVSTNIAETSITIDDVVYVIDCGKMKIGNYDVDNDLKTLMPEWVSHANAVQRQGRAGRVRPGKCYRLYTGLVFSELAPRIAPEIIRSPVHEPLLASLLLRLHPAPQFLASLLDPPHGTAVNTAVNLLARMDILNEVEHLTALGVHVARLPVSPGAAKMLIYASLLSAVTPITRVAAVVAFKDPFTLVIGKEREVEQCRVAFSQMTFSDQLAAAEAQRQWENIHNRGDRREASAFCWDNFLSERTLQMLRDMRHQFGQLLCDTHFTSDPDPDDPDANRHSDNIPLLKALIVAGLYPNVAYFQGRHKRKHNLRTEEDGRVEIHPGSVNASCLPDTTHLVYRLKQLSTSLFVHDTSPAHALPLLFFGDQFHKTDDDNDPNKCVIWSGTLCWSSTWRKAKLVERLRQELHALLKERLQDPRPVAWDSQEGTVLSAIIELIASEGEEDEGR